MSYPPARRLDLRETIHGVEVADPYRWLEDPASPETRAWSAAQDELAGPYLAALPARQGFRSRLEKLLRVGTITPPQWRGDRCFYMRRDPHQEHAVLIVREPDGGERVLLDPVAIDPAGTTTLDSWQPSKEGRLLAYQLSTGGDEESRLRVVEVATGEVVDGPIDRCRYSPVAWLPGGEELYYVRRLAPGEVPPGEEMYHRRVYRHRLGSDPERDDVEVFGAGRDKTEYYGAQVSSPDGRWLIVTANQGTSPHGDSFIADLEGDGELRPIALRSITAPWVDHDGRLYLYTRDGTPNGRLDVADPAAPTERTTLIAESDAVLEDVEVATGRLLATYLRDCTNRIEILDSDGARLGEIPLPGPGAAGVVTRPEGGLRGWVGYTDFGEPASVYEYDLETGRMELWGRAPGAEALGDGVAARQVFYESRDGTRVPMFVLSRPGYDPDGRTPVILNGYGGFNASNLPAYNTSARAWVEAGGVFAIANLRGGGEYGEAWHEAGMREHKQNVFDDFVAAAEWLVRERYTSPARLAIMGGSNGGLLVGAALTQRPELFQAVACSAPLLDMVRYERFGLGATWNHEYGRADDPVEFGWLYSYSPYHHVRQGVEYPAVLFTLFDSDTRVDPMHGRKLCAALQWATASDRPVLLRRETDVGHGPRAVSRSAELAADVLAFLAHQLGAD